MTHVSLLALPLLAALALGSSLDIQFGVTAEDARDGKGVRVVEVVPGSPAQAAGISEGDVLLSIGGTPTSDVERFASAFDGRKAGETLEVALLRGGDAAKRLTLSVTLAEAKPPVAGDDGPGAKARVQRVTPGERVTIRGGDGEKGGIAIQRTKEGSAPAVEVERGTGTGFLGVSALYQGDEEQLRVIEITPNSGAERAGLRVGDVILEVGGESIDSYDRFGRSIRSRKPGDPLALLVQRGDEKLAITATLGERPRELAVIDLEPSDGAMGVAPVAPMPSIPALPRVIRGAGVPTAAATAELEAEVKDLRAEMKELKAELAKLRKAMQELKGAAEKAEKKSEKSGK